MSLGDEVPRVVLDETIAVDILLKLGATRKTHYDCQKEEGYLKKIVSTLERKKRERSDSGDAEQWHQTDMKVMMVYPSLFKTIVRTGY